MDCLHVRELLPELVLSGLPPDERRLVQQHLDWCAGCRKEAGELAAGAALVGRAVPQLAPPSWLESGVIRDVGLAAGRGGPRRRASRVLGSAIAAILTLAIVGWGTSITAEIQSERKARSHAEQEAAQLSSELARIVNLIRKTQAGSGDDTAPLGEARQGTLAPPPGREGGGGAVVYTSPTDKDWAIVIVGGLSSKLLPYRVMLRSSSGQTLLVGKITELDSGGGGEVWTRFPQNLRPFRAVLVRDRGGRPALRGTLPQTSATPAPSPSDALPPAAD